jgi:hypothetical protein
MKAKVVSLLNGLQEFENLEMIRIKSNRHTLLIMKNFMPVIGELEGSVEFVFEKDIVKMENLKGYYMHKKNDFSLLVEEGDTTPVGAGEVADA